MENGQDTEQNENVNTIELNTWTLSPTEEIGDETISRFSEFFEIMRTLGFIDNWKKMYGAYLGRTGENKTIGLQKMGASGEFIGLHINNLRSTIRSILGIILSNPPNFDIIATNADSASTQLASLCKNLIDYYMSHSRINLKQKLFDSVEMAYITGSGYVLVEWDAEAKSGSAKTDDMFDGDVTITCPSPFDVCFDPYIDSWEDLEWVIVRQWHSKISLARRFPEFASEIESLDTKDSAVNFSSSGSSSFMSEYHSSKGSLNQQVATFKLFHRAVPELSEGRYIWTLNNGTVLYEGSLPYDRVPLERFIVDKIPGTPFGRTPLEDMLPIQESLDLLNSTIITNQYATGLQIIACEEGTDLSPTTLGAGIALVKFPSGSQPPKGINLTATNPEVFQYLQKLEQEMNQIVGVSEVSRGQNTGNLSSGSALALASSMSAQNQGPVLQGYNDFCARTATLVLKIIRTFAVNQRTLAIIGENKSSQVLFNQDDLKEFDRIHVTQGNPLTATMAGRLQVAQQLVSNNLITNPKQFIDVLVSGNLDLMTDPVSEEDNYIIRENELMRDGEEVILLILDNHNAHIDVHRRMLNDQRFRTPNTDETTSKILQLVMSHIKEHMNLLNGPQPGAPAPPPGPGGPPGAPPGAGGPPPGHNGPPPGPPGAPPPAEGPPAPPSLPEMIEKLSVQLEMMGIQEKSVRDQLKQLVQMAAGQQMPPPGVPVVPPQHLVSQQHPHNPDGRHVPHRPPSLPGEGSLKPHKMEHPGGPGNMRQNIAGGIPGMPAGQNTHNAVSAGIVNPSNPAVLQAAEAGVRFPNVPKPKGMA